MRILIFLMTIASNAAYAEPIEPVKEDEVPANSWHLSLTLGFGTIESPIILQENFDFYALPNISWYGERFYFVNGLVGFSLSENAQQQWDLVLYPSFEGVLFNLSHAVTPALASATQQINSNAYMIELAERDLTWMAGVRYAYRWQGKEWAVSLARDANGVHEGWESAVSLHHPDALRGEQWRIGYLLKATYKSQSVVDYYFGLHPEDIYTVYLDSIRVNPGFLYEAQFNAEYRLSQRWALNALYRYSEYDHQISASPILKTAHMQTWFAGVGYHF